MTDPVTTALLSFLAAHPWVIWVWFAFSIMAVAIRAAYPVTEERPRWIVAILAVVDVLQANWSGPVKLVAKPKG